VTDVYMIRPLNWKGHLQKPGTKLEIPATEASVLVRRGFAVLTEAEYLHHAGLTKPETEEVKEPEPEPEPVAPEEVPEAEPELESPKPEPKPKNKKK